MSEQLTCPLCAHTEELTLIPHLRNEHKIEPDVFTKQFPEQGLAYPSFAAFLAQRQVGRTDGILHYQLDVAGTPMNARFQADHPLIPQPDDTFVWTEPCRDVAEAIEHNERVLLYGPSGTGKSSLVRQIAALVNRPVRRVSLNGETSVADFVGHWTVNENKQTVFVRGILPQAMENGFMTDALEDLIAETRKYRVGLTLAHQYMKQFGSRKADALSSMGATVIFNVNTKDARFLVDDLRGLVDVEDLITLELGEAIVRAGTEVVRVATCAPPGIPEKNCRERIIAESRRRYCTPAHEVRRALRRRCAPWSSTHGMPHPLTSCATDGVPEELVYDVFP